MNWQFWTFTALYWVLQLAGCADNIKNKKAGILFASLVVSSAFQALVTFAVLAGVSQ